MQKITKIWAFLAKNSDDDSEGIVGMAIGGAHVQAVCGTEKMRDRLIPLIREEAKRQGIKITLAEFTSREDLETFK